jgi:hypothetical protein
VDNSLKCNLRSIVSEEVGNIAETMENNGSGNIGKQLKNKRKQPETMDRTGPETTETNPYRGGDFVSFRLFPRGSFRNCSGQSS